MDEDNYYKGSVVIDKKIYKDVFLKYDIYNQQVLLLIEHPLGGNKQIILNNLQINEFEINGRIFHKFTFPGTTTLFYQVIGNDEMAFLNHFKNRRSQGQSTNILYQSLRICKRNRTYTGSQNCMHSRETSHLSESSPTIKFK